MASIRNDPKIYTTGSASIIANGNFGIILVTVEMEGNVSRQFQMALDTGSSSSCFDRDTLIIENYNLDNPIGKVKAETANGIIEMEVFEAETLSAFGITRHNVHIYVYDFLAHGITSSYQGVLGLDFFENTKFCIDMRDNTISVLPSSPFFSRQSDLSQ